jgi:hypothetical protein
MYADKWVYSIDVNEAAAVSGCCAGGSGAATAMLFQLSRNIWAGSGAAKAPALLHLLWR